MLSLLKKLTLVTLAAITFPLGAQTAEERGLEIVIEADRRDTGFGDFSVEMAMLLRNAQGEEAVRHMRNRIMEVEGDGDKSMIVFDRPRDVKGTALLTFTHKAGADDQWLYLPALKRVKRIASRNKSGPFMGRKSTLTGLSKRPSCMECQCSWSNAIQWTNIPVIRGNLCGFIKQSTGRRK